MKIEKTTVSIFHSISKNNFGEAEALRFKSELYMTLEDLIEASKMSKKEVSKLLGISKKRVKKLVNGKFADFNIQELIGFIAMFGYSIHIELDKSQKVKVKSKNIHLSPELSKKFDESLIKRGGLIAKGRLKPSKDIYG